MNFEITPWKESKTNGIGKSRWTWRRQTCQTKKNCWNKFPQMVMVQCFNTYQLGSHGCNHGWLKIKGKSRPPPKKREMQHQLMEYAFANIFTFIAINFCKSFHFVSVCSNRLSLPFFFLALSLSRFQLPSLSLCSSVFLSLSVVLSFSLRLISLCGWSEKHNAYISIEQSSRLFHTGYGIVCF